MAAPFGVPLERLCETCELIYKRDGYVKWAEVAEIYGVSRQAIQSRIKREVTKGTLSPECVNRWQSMSSRAAYTRRRKDTQDLNSRMRLDIQLTVDNLTWLDSECINRGSTRTDIVNGLINKERSKN